MLKQGNFFFEEGGDTIESPLIKEMYYNCTKCSSPVELLYINERQNLIEFKCTKNNHIKKIPIKEYLEKMKKFNDKKINDGYVMKIIITKNMNFSVWIVISIYAKNV